MRMAPWDQSSSIKDEVIWEQKKKRNGGAESKKGMGRRHTKGCQGGVESKKKWGKQHRQWRERKKNITMHKQMVGEG